MSERREHTVTEAEAGRRLDVVLAALWDDLTRSRLQRLIGDGRVTVAGEPVRARDAAVAGSVVTVELPAPEPSPLTPADIPLSIAYEDDHLLVVDKPAGMVVHPGAGQRTHTLLNALLHRAPDLIAVGGRERPGIVHRLDKGTSGLLLVAKSDLAFRKLSQALARREIQRTYLALIWGDPRDDEARVAAAIGRHPRDRKRMAVVAGGRDAATRYRVIERFSWTALLECRLETGRTHQIRVHLAHAGHPVLGDSTYGGGPRRALNLVQSHLRLSRQVFGLLQRPALHAARLEFSHPATGDTVTLDAPLPEDFATALKVLRQPGRSSDARRSL